MSFIEIKNLKKIYNANKSIEVEALKSINLIIEKGDFCSIVGVSGSGKSTLLYILGCIDKQTEGTYLLEGKNVSMMSENELAQIRNKKIGFYQKGTNELVEIDTCHLLKEQLNEVIKILKNIDLKDIKEIMIRTNENKDIMIKTIGTIKNDDILKILKINNLKSLYQDDKLIYEEPYIKENINNIKYTIYPDAFFQVNKEGMIKLYDLNRKYAEKGNKLLDLYCGTGTIGIYLSDLYKEVFGIEINKDSIKNAKLNKKLNNIKNIDFICSDASNIKEKYDTITVDPPRVGLSKKVIEKILEIKPEKIIYTSCNPNTLKRDIKLLEENYSVKEITPVNMFPKTEHIECIALLTHK